jgi:hypothetical protein
LWQSPIQHSSSYLAKNQFQRRHLLPNYQLSSFILLSILDKIVLKSRNFGKSKLQKINQLKMGQIYCYVIEA